MRHQNITLYFVLLFIVLSCSQPKKSEKTIDTSVFEEEIQQLKAYFKIPGMAVLVKKKDEIIYEEYLGKSDVKNNIDVDTITLFPIASLTKVFTGITILKLAEEHKVSLEDSLTKYFPKLALGDSVKLKHVLSHTSQGTPGKNFYYNYRFGALTRVIAETSGSTFDEAVHKNIIDPLSLRHTFLLNDSTQLKTRKEPFAQPYIFEEQIKDGFVDYGASASAGIVSTARDLAVLDNALDQNLLISEASKNLMFTPFQSHLPYGYGIFSETFNNTKLIWAYGQYDCYSSLFLKVPTHDLTLILLANNNLMSDPARLIYSNATSSLFVMSFLKNFAFEQSSLPLFETEQTSTDTIPSVIMREKLRAQALAASFMARFDTDEMKTSTALLQRIFSEYPNYLEYADLTLLHNLSFLKEVALHKDLGTFNEFDPQIEAIGKMLLQKDADNPYANYYLGGFYDKKGDTVQAKTHYERIINAKNFSRNWYTAEAQNWLDTNK